MLSTERNFVIVFLVVFLKIDQGIHCLASQTIDNILSLSTRNRYSSANSSTQNYNGSTWPIGSSLYYRGDSFRSRQSANVPTPPRHPDKIGSFLKIVISPQFNYYVKKEPYAIVAFTLIHKKCERTCELLEQLKRNTDYKDITLFLVDIDEALSVANTFSVNSVPTLISFRQGEQFETLPPQDTQDKNLIENMFINLLNKDKQANEETKEKSSETIKNEEPQQTENRKVEKKVTFNDTTEYNEEPKKTTDIATTKNETIETTNNTTKKEEPKQTETNTSDNGTRRTISKTTSGKDGIKKKLSKFSSTSAGTSVSECKTKILKFYKDREYTVYNDNMLIILSIQHNFKILDFKELDSDDVNTAIPDLIDSNEPNSVENLQLKQEILTHLSLTTTMKKKPKKRSKIAKTVKNILGQKDKLVPDLLGKFFDYTFQVALCGFNKIKNELETGEQFCKRVTKENYAQETMCINALKTFKYPLDNVGVSFFHAFFILDHIYSFGEGRRLIRKGYAFDYEDYIEDKVVSYIEDDCYRTGKSVEEYCAKLSDKSKT